MPLTSDADRMSAPGANESATVEWPMPRESVPLARANGARRQPDERPRQEREREAVE